MQTEQMSTDDQPLSVAAVVVTFNRREVLARTLVDILGQNRAPDTVIVVDNASSDCTGDLLRERFRDRVHYIRHDDNLGAGAGQATGMRHAHGEGHDLLWLLDDDSRPHPDALRRLVTQVRARPTIGVLGFSGGTVRRGVIRHSPPMRTQEATTPTVSTCDFVLLDGAIVTRAAVAAAGYPRSDFFLMLDDVEYSMRVKRTGLDVGVLSPDLIDRGHMGSSAPWRLYYQTRNELLMARDLRSPIAFYGWLVRQLRFVAGHLLWSDRKWKRLGFRLRGAWDGARSIRGRTVEPR